MNARQIALGGVMAALAVVVMCFGGMIPLATYILPMLCCILLGLIAPRLSMKGGWVWYCAVSLLSLLLCPDKEAAAVYLFLGYYPLVKPAFDRKKHPFIPKLLLFNAATLTMYALLIHLFGMAALAAEFAEMGVLLTAVTLVLGNVCFFMLDRLLNLLSKRFRRS